VPTKPAPMTESIERLVPGALAEDDVTGRETYELHMARYDFAAQFVTSGDALDCACGVGYGSKRLLDGGACDHRVLGVDIDSAAVEFACANYVDDRLSFRCADGSEFDGGPFSTIVSLETIEHVPDPKKLIANFVRMLAPGGRIIASVPVTPSVDVNPYHLHDFTAGSFRRMFLDHGLQEIAAFPQRQPYSPLRMVAGREKRLKDMRSGLVGYYASHPGAAAKRLYSTLVDGFCNKYLTCVFTKA
jgi:2-polyprenyl-3-methyl-5-hydroxy-6-metoxy-1,4-benzoquinol methylase